MHTLDKVLILSVIISALISFAHWEKMPDFCNDEFAGEVICNTDFVVSFTDQHVNGCHGAKTFILNNVTSDSLKLYVTESVIINGGSLNNLEIITITCP